MQKNINIVSWNVNGIRALYKKGVFGGVFQHNTDFVCFQETKAHVEQLIDEIVKPSGYLSFFDHSKIKKGYSGVAIYMKDTLPKPNKIEYGFGVKSLDQEGRMISLFFDNWVLINCYFPNGGGAPERLKYKLDFYREFLKYVKNIEKQGLNVIFCGDVNVAHAEIDLARPKQNINSIGFLPEERFWIDEFIKEGFVDVYRELNPNKKDVYTWWDMKTFSRQKNVGWRIDYFFVSRKILKNVIDCQINSDVFGSDHCPIKLVVDNLF